MRHKNWVTASALERWADHISARSLLPQLLRRLVHATLASTDIEKIEFPSGEGVQRPGIDGITKTKVGNAKVPFGVSCWEAGCDKSTKTKADGDYAKRSPDQGAAFIFVTPRKWAKKCAWSESKQNQGWREVRAYDSSDIEEWLELAPAVDVWFAHEIGLKPPGVSDLATHWQNVVSSLRVQLPPSIVLTDRSKQVQEFLEWLAKPASALAVEANSSDEVIDFIAAVAADIGNDEQAKLDSKALIVEDRDAWCSLATSSGNLLLITAPRLELEPELIAEAVRQGNHVAFAASKRHQTQGARIEIRRMFQCSLSDALKKTTLGEAEVDRIAEESGGSFTVLRRMISNDIQHAAPPWSHNEHTCLLASMMLCGAWDDSNPADKDKLERVTGLPYPEVLTFANRLRVEADAPIKRTGTVWSFVSRLDSWRLLHWSLTSDLLSRFVTEASDILAEPNPAYELPVNERYLASIKGKTLKNSHALREGCCETLALLGAERQTVKTGDACVLTTRSLIVVRRLLENADWHRWASLSGHLTDLAEAAPEEFLQAVENDLRKPHPELKTLFDQEGDAMFGGCPHTGLLWALEVLAWDPRFLGRVANALVRLSLLDPGGAVSNRPSGSLHGIFLCWHPQTMVVLNERLQILSRLLRQFPEAAWNLLLALLPKTHGFTLGTYKPKWQNWLSSWRSGVTYEQYFDNVFGVAELLINNVGLQAGRWTSLANHVKQLPGSSIDKFLDKLETASDDTSLNLEQTDVWNSLRSIAQHHRWAQGLEWALPIETVLKLERAAEKLAPKDPLELYYWLFASEVFIRIGHRDMPHEEIEGLVLKEQKTALHQIWKAHGLNGILEMARRSTTPWKYGSIVQQANLPFDHIDVISSFLNSQENGIQGFAKGFLGSCYDLFGWDWLQSLPLEKWSVEQTAAMLRVVPFQPRLWKLACSLGPQVEASFWKSIWCHAHRLTDEELMFVVTKLREVGRHYSVVRIAQDAMHLGMNLHADFIFDTLESTIFAGEPILEDPGDMDGLAHDIFDLYRHIRDRADIDEARLMRLEWVSLDMLHSNQIHPKALHRNLAKDSSQLAEILALSYRPRSDREKPKVELSKDAKDRAQKAHKLIESWCTLPGGQPDGTVNHDELSLWIKEARQRCLEKDLLAIGDLKIGGLLFHSPNEADGTWPCLAVRNALEDTNSPEMLRGFETAIMNSRGMHSRSLTEGGDQERDLAKKYQHLADQIRGGWPMVSAAIQQVADSYMSEAQQQDERMYDG